MVSPPPDAAVAYSPVQVLAALAARGVSLEGRAGRLRSSGPSGAIDAALAEGLRRHRDAILAAVGEGRFDPANPARVLAAAHWHAEHDAIADCARLAPAPQGEAGEGVRPRTVGPVGSMRLLAAVLFTLWRWTGGDTVAVRVASAAGTMPLRVAPAQAESFAELCAAVLAGYRDAVRFRRHGGEAMRLAGAACQIELAPAGAGAAPADLAGAAWITFARRRDGTGGAGEWMVHNLARAFDATQAGWFAAAVAACLEHTADPGISLAALAGRLAPARSAVWPADTSPLPAVSVAQLIAEQAGRTPDAPALAGAKVELSYRELNSRANALAARLLANGAIPGKPLGILLRRGPAVPVCFLAALKAGLCLAPLDPDWPAERLAAVLRRLAPPLLVVDGLRADLRVPQLAWSELAPLPDDPPAHGAPDHPVYVIHTSGSTGTPKAAINFQRGLLNRLLFMDRYFGRAAARAVLQTTPHWFDSALWQFFWPWIGGGCCVIEDTDGEPWAGAAAGQIARDGVTLTDFTPSRLRVFLDGIDAGARLPLRHVIVGGELLSAGVIAAFRDKLPQVRLHNFYGPSETAIGVVCADVTGLAPEVPVPIGRPIDNVYVRVVDRQGNELPAGAAGELLIGGACVGGGYLGDAAETARLFIPDPGRRDGPAVYRSGDLVRYLADGSLQFLGRGDGQVKLRGVRIECQEVRHALESCAGVAQAYVALRGQGDRARLMAYVVLARDAGGGREGWLRQELARRLPAHMVPYAIVALSELPLRSSGKVDESSLPDHEPAPAGAAPLHGYRAAMGALWSEVLECGPLGEHDDFFARGGHSLLTAKLIARIRQRFGIAVPLRLLLGEPVLGRFADAVLRCAAGAPCPNPVPLRKDGAAAPLFLVHGGDGELIYARHLAAELPPGLPVYGFGAPGLQPGEAAVASLAELAAGYVAALRQVQPHGPYRLGGWSAGGMIGYEMARQLEAQGERVAALVMIDTPRYAVLEAAAMPARGRAAQLAQLRLLTPVGGADGLPAEDDVDAWLAWGRRAGWLHADAGVEEAGRILALRLALARAVHGYRRPPPACPVLLAIAADAGRTDPLLGWDAAPSWRFTYLPGDHQGIVASANAGALARAVHSFISNAT